MMDAEEPHQREHVSEPIHFFTLACAYVRLNLAAQWEYRGAFLSQVVGMILNNCVWITFWCIFLKRFNTVGGWQLNDVISVWAMSATAFGLAYSICGNAIHLPSMIARGQLDAWMLYPRALLPHLLVGRMSATALGDVVFGIAVYLIFVKPDAIHFALFIALTISAAFVFVGFSVLTSSLAFYLGNVDGLAETARFALITFSTYPASLFEGFVKVLLYTALPAGLISYLPVEALRNVSPTDAALAVAGSLMVLFAGVAVFYQGLKRYESGNLMEMRG